MKTVVQNLCNPLPDASPVEAVSPLVSARGLRLERIVSHGQASADGFWYDQADAEWVMVVTGRARLAIAGEGEDRELGPGDAIFLPAHCRHRVTWTDPDQPTVWVALFVAPEHAPVAQGLA